ncbi:unnamed protein product [Prorocentrum cordatum]|uniref:Glycosyltransferase 2-like domain-containing protein n=1 Tax=Prorocentrum cordatum TaxID=2364126 RepID=A0ABN9SMN7_9DINO|nr:unnamed protein product [Polarella glacialis]
MSICDARRPGQDQHGPGRPRVVALLASHLGDEDRLWKLERCLQSIAAQEEPPAEVLVRWSAAGAELEAQACELLDGCGLPCALTAWRAEPAAQFEHYAALGSRLLSGRPAAELDEAWLIFSDDDDIWHPRRAAHFSRAAAAAAGCGGLAAGVFRDARPRDPGARPRSAGDVEALLRSGLAEQTGDTELMGAGFRLEYFHYCVRPALLAAFLQRAPAALLSSPYCDLALAEFARLASWANGPPPLHDPGRDDWMYYARWRTTTAARAPTPGRSRAASRGRPRSAASRSTARTSRPWASPRRTRCGPWPGCARTWT